jgi:hypothetical protein
MKQIFKISSVAAALATIVVVGPGCSKIKDFGTTNVNPGGTSTPVTAALLTNVESGLGANYATSVTAGQYAQYFSETQYPGTSLYTAPILSFSGTYSGDLYDLQNIINQNTDPATKSIVAASGSNANQIAVARILKAYIFWTITDRWGDIPYSEALKGAAVKLPKYDKQQDIYVDLIKELKESVAMFDNNGVVFKGDILMNYAGTATATVVNTKWKKFANSLRMLIALRTSKIYPNAGQWAATEFNAALTDPGGILTANTDNVAQVYPNTTFANPWYANYVTSSRVDNAESKTVTDYLSANNDPRLASYGTTPNGFPYGLDRPHATLIVSGIAYILKGQSIPATDPVYLLTASVVTFARAEAAERGWTTEVAATLYASAVTLSLTQYGYTSAQALTYLAQPAIAYGTSNLQKIATQRWLATYPDGTQAWAEWRRTGFPVLTPSAYAVNVGGQIPRRYIYGTDEYSLNAANVKLAAANYTGGDGQDSKVWWDK